MSETETTIEQQSNATPAEETPAENPAELPQAVLDEVMMPELSEDFFMFEGRKVQLRPLKVKNQKRFAKAFEPVVDGMAYDLAQNAQIMYIDEQGKTRYRAKTFGDLSIADWVLVSKALINQSDVLPTLIQILCDDDGYEVTDEQMDECRMQQKEMQAIILKFTKKSDGIERKVADFFEHALPRVEGEITKMLDQAAAFVETKTGTANTAS